jgi:hypothetical protein
VLAANAYSSQRMFDDAIGMLQSASSHAPDDRKPLIREALADVRKQLAGPGFRWPPGTPFRNLRNESRSAVQMP